MSHRILLVDDEPDILEFVGYNLRRAGHEVFTAADGEQALELARTHRPHLILLDVMMPRLDGLATCRALRADPALTDTMIVFLSALGRQEEDLLSGYEAGADDYIAKPIQLKVLLSRVEAILRRISQGPPEGALRIDPVAHQVWVGQEQVFLPRKEFMLLELLNSQPGRLFTREEIYDHVWGDKVVVGDRTIDVHIRKLRQKIGEEHISTVKGLGYKILLPL